MGDSEATKEQVLAAGRAVTEAMMQHLGANHPVVELAVLARTLGLLCRRAPYPETALRVAMQTAREVMRDPRLDSWDHV